MTSAQHSLTPLSVHGESRSRRVLVETVIVLGVTFAGLFAWESLRTIVAFLPLAYFLVERQIRGRSWAQVGFNLRDVPRGLAANWHLILVVSVVVQIAVVGGARLWLPGYLEHVVARIPFSLGQFAVFVPLLLVATLIEEIGYRALFQERLSWFMPPAAAIALVSIVFGIAHWSPGSAIIVTIDVLLVVLDGAIYGVIYQRSKSVIVAWMAHFLADLFPILLLQAW